MSHWYREGKSCFTVVGKNGKERATTVKDARELGLVPSVTTILQYKAKPELDLWKQKQAIMAALTLPRLENETDEDFVDRVLTDSKAQGKAAADKGTFVHAYIEALVSGHPVSPREDLQDLCSKLNDWVKEHALSGKCETVLFNDQMAGTCDFISDDKMIIADFKTFSSKKDEKIKPYDEWLMQLAAYRSLYGAPSYKCQNIVISTTEPGRIEVIEHDEEDLKYALEEFNHIYQAFKACKRL